ncbi:DUF2064 domain-containing protein [uncultured Friedmanniella sp.]|uniref:DUF2064 domain-containing protein n=1 Tax=uncultured Friedmanniella sp. TaxID=335381 RepID=UPI0035C9D0DA
MSTEPGSVLDPAGPPRRVALVLARYGAGPAAPTGVSPAELARAALADSYEVLADLVGVRSGIAGPAAVTTLLWPGGLRRPDVSVGELASGLAGEADELVVVAADVPDLPALVLAKAFKVLHRSDAVVAPARTGGGCVALGLRLPLARWLAGMDLDLDADLVARLTAAAPARGLVAAAPDWHRLRTPADLRRLDPGLEGWEETRALLEGTPGSSRNSVAAAPAAGGVG